MPDANNVNNAICSNTTGSHGKKMLPPISNATVNKPISILNCTTPCNEFENTSTSRGNATLRTKAAFASIEFIPRFVTSMKKFHGNNAHNKYNANDITLTVIPEPATLGLFGLSLAVALLHRRRQARRRDEI